MGFVVDKVALGADFSPSTSVFLPWQSEFIYLTILSRVGGSIMFLCLLSELLVSNLARGAFPTPGDEGNPPAPPVLILSDVITSLVSLDRGCVRQKVTSHAHRSVRCVTSGGLVGRK